MAGALPPVDHCGSCASCLLVNSLLDPGGAPAADSLPVKPADDRRYLAWMNTVQRELAEERTTPPKKPECVASPPVGCGRGSTRR